MTTTQLLLEIFPTSLKSVEMLGAGHLDIYLKLSSVDLH
jgi:hypothetical protein